MAEIAAGEARAGEVGEIEVATEKLDSGPHHAASERAVKCRSPEPPAQQVAILEPRRVESGSFEARVGQIATREPSLVESPEGEARALLRRGVGEHAVLKNRFAQIGMGKATAHKAAVQQARAP
jgi:hypothetical protein